MLARTFALGLALAASLAVATTTSAQSSSNPEPEKERKFLNRIDNFGKSVFAGILPSDKDKSDKDKSDKGKSDKGKKSSRAASEKSADAGPEDKDLPSAEKRVGSLPEKGGVGRSRSMFDPTLDSATITPDNTPSAVVRRADGTPKTLRRPVTESVLIEEPKLAEDRVQQAPATSSAKTTAPRVVTPSVEAVAPVIKRPSQALIHQRLSASRESVFDDEDDEAQPTAPNVTATSKPERATQKVEPAMQKAEAAASKAKTATPKTEPPAQKPDRYSAVSPVRPQPAEPKAAATPKLVQRPRPSLSMRDTIAAEPAPVVPTPAASEKISSDSLPVLVGPGMTEPGDRDPGLLMSRGGPALSVETLGPRRIAVGREATYEVNLVNSGDVAGEELVVFVTMPEWAEVAGAQASKGSVAANAVNAAGSLQWKLGHLDAKGRERLTLKIIPRQSRPFDLAVRWEYRPVASQTMIEVQEPKLHLQLEGPREVIYGKKVTYRLRLSNAGNGSAENVSIMLMPLGGNENIPATYKLGMLGAGEEKSLDVELTARQAGGLTIQVDARADGGIHAELAEKVLVRRAGLTIDVQGPKVQFVQVPATYTIRVRNPGTAPARNVKLTIVLPAGARYLSGIEGARFDAATSRLEWTIDNIAPEVEQMFSVRCTLGSAGMNRLQVNATAADDLTTAAAADTHVEAVANLVMDVTDPEGPVAVGDEATYEIHVRNRGTKEASNVEVFAYFSRGIEPTGADGAAHRMIPGQISFEPIRSLGPGSSATFKVRARAEVAGSHVFRAEAHCRPLNARLIQEATNLYYTDATGSPPAAPSRMETVPANAMRTVAHPDSTRPVSLPPRQ